MKASNTVHNLQGFDRDYVVSQTGIIPEPVRGFTMVNMPPIELLQEAAESNVSNTDEAEG